MSTLALSSLVDESTFTSSSLLAPDQTGQRITGSRVVLEWIVRSWLQPRGRNRLAPNVGADVRDLENAALDEATQETWRVWLREAALKASIGYLAEIDVTVTFESRTTFVSAVAILSDGSRHTLAVTLSQADSVVRFGGTL